jgi:hypothetical protein
MILLKSSTVNCFELFPTLVNKKQHFIYCLTYFRIKRMTAIKTNTAVDQFSSSSKDRLLFVYNADSGLLNMLKDWTHKIVSPSTYDCRLCALTYGNTGMYKKWNQFISNLSLSTLFLHRDEFHQRYPDLKAISLPCVLIDRNDDQSVKVLLDAQTINQQETLDQLIDTCTRSVESLHKV